MFIIATTSALQCVQSPKGISHFQYVVLKLPQSLKYLSAGLKTRLNKCIGNQLEGICTSVGKKSEAFPIKESF